MKKWDKRFIQGALFKKSIEIFTKSKSDTLRVLLKKDIFETKQSVIYLYIILYNIKIYRFYGKCVALVLLHFL